MKKAPIIFSTLLLASSLSFAHGDGANTSAKIAELSVHRIDRLVTLNKIDPSFMKNTVRVEVADVENQAPVAFKVMVSQTQPANGNPLQIAMSFDKDGKPLAFQSVDGGTAGPDSAWPGADSVTLTENALHYLLDNPTDATAAPFYDDLGSVEIAKANLSGQDVAVAHMTTMDGLKKLNVYLKLDGTLIKAEAVRK